MKLDEILTSENPMDTLPADGGFTSIFRTIACVGDSLSSGEFESFDEKENLTHYHDMYEYSWGQVIGRMCGSKVYNFSRGGMTAREYCDSFAQAQDFWNPDYAAHAYIVALGVNDLIYCGDKLPIGSLEDVDFSDWRNNRKTFTGYYGQILQRLKEIQPRAKFFLMTMPPENESEEQRGVKEAHRKILCDFADRMENVYVLDFLEHAPCYDEEFKRRFYLRGHLNPMGYVLTGKMVASYIDYIIRHNMEDFREVGFIGTDLHG